MSSVRLAVAVALSLLTSSAGAEGLSVLGFQLGKTSPDEVTAALSPKGKVSSGSMNYYSRGPMLKVEGRALPVEGLKEAIFIFDAGQHLEAVDMKLDKTRFDTFLKRLKAKYEVVLGAVPPVGDKLVRFHDGTTTIVLTALQMSSDMRVCYIDDDLFARFEADNKKGAIEKEQREAAQF